MCLALVFFFIYLYLMCGYSAFSFSLGSLTIPNTMVFENLIWRHGVKMYSNASVEDVCLAVGDVVNHENIVSASQMNNAIVLFLSTIEKANEM